MEYFDTVTINVDVTKEQMETLANLIFLDCPSLEKIDRPLTININPNDFDDAHRNQSYRNLIKVIFGV